MEQLTNIAMTNTDAYSGSGGTYLEGRGGSGFIRVAR